eukprot:615542-Hanusia_phi.AAC.1
MQRSELAVLVVVQASDRVQASCGVRPLPSPDISGRPADAVDRPEGREGLSKDGAEEFMLSSQFATRGRQE